ncbi:MAG: S-adenosylmethionine:tRNA ribosyltransferase-isomerase, partial [Bacteroidia bacterium]
MQPQHISITNYRYDLPETRIATYPLENRDASKLLIYKDKGISEKRFYELPDLLKPETLLIFNNTKVAKARLLFEKETGGQIEIFCLEPAHNLSEMSVAMLQTQKTQWKCLVGGARKWKTGKLQLTFSIEEEKGLLTAEKIAHLGDTFLIEFAWTPEKLCFAEILSLAGNIPLPPYFNRKPEASDQLRYQTVYAEIFGSVAAPTAGLHFTEAVLADLRKKNIEIAPVTLHVGAGTFKPVKAETMAGHEMHTEFIEVEKGMIEKLHQQLLRHKQIVVVGTTSLRTIETLYWLGVKIIENQVIAENELELFQWDAYELPQQHSPQEALLALLNWLTAHHFTKLC